MRARVGTVARRLAWPALFTAALAVVAGVGIVPTRTYLDRKAQLAAAEARLSELERSNEEARRRVEQLQTDAEIERLAREQYGLVKKGEEAYRIVPPPQDAVQVPDVWPFDRLHRPSAGTESSTTPP